MRVRSLGREDPLEEGLATHFSILAWEIPWIEESGRLQSIRPQTVGHDQSNLAHFVPPFLHSNFSTFPWMKMSYFYLYLSNYRKWVFQAQIPYFIELCIFSVWDSACCIAGAPYLFFNKLVSWSILVSKIFIEPMD